MSDAEEVVCVGAILVALLGGYLAGHAVGSRRRPPSRVKVRLRGPRHRR